VVDCEGEEEFVVVEGEGAEAEARGCAGDVGVENGWAREGEGVVHCWCCGDG